MESLIKAGAFDSLGARRASLAAVLDRALQTGAAALADRRSGQKGLFGAEDDDPQPTANLPDVPEWPERERLAAEKEVLGFYLSSHPLAEHQATLSTFCSHSTTDLPNVPNRNEVLVGGIISALKLADTKSPRRDSTNTRYAMFDLEDMAGIVRCIAWPEQYAVHRELIAADSIVAIKGAIDRRPGSDETNLIVSEVLPLPALAGRYTRGVRFTVDEQQHDQRAIESLYEIVRGYPGRCDLELEMSLLDGAKVSLKCDKLRVDLDPELRRRVDELLGPGHVQPIVETPSMVGSRNGIRPAAAFPR
jgi:DNA polymerase-3 subunit alpha